MISPNFKRGAAGRVFLEAMMAFENLHVGVLVGQHFAGQLAEFHSQVHRRLMLGDQSKGMLAACANMSICLGSKPVVATTSGSSLLPARFDDRLGRAWGRRSRSRDRLARVVRSQWEVQWNRAGDETGILAEEGVVRRFQRGGHSQLRIGRAKAIRRRPMRPAAP